MPVVTKDQVLEILSSAVRQKLPPDELLEVCNEVFPAHPFTEEAHKDSAPLAEQLLAHLHSGLGIDEIVDLWRVGEERTPTRSRKSGLLLHPGERRADFLQALRTQGEPKEPGRLFQVLQTVDGGGQFRGRLRSEACLDGFEDVRPLALQFALLRHSRTTLDSFIFSLPMIPVTSSRGNACSPKMDSNASASSLGPGVGTWCSMASAAYRIASRGCLPC